MNQEMQHSRSGTPSMRLRRKDGPRYRVWTRGIPGEITPKRRGLTGAFDDGSVGS